MITSLLAQADPVETVMDVLLAWFLCGGVLFSLLAVLSVSLVIRSRTARKYMDRATEHMETVERLLQQIADNTSS